MSFESTSELEKIKTRKSENQTRSNQRHGTNQKVINHIVTWTLPIEPSQNWYTYQLSINQITIYNFTPQNCQQHRHYQYLFHDDELKRHIFLAIYIHWKFLNCFMNFDNKFWMLVGERNRPVIYF